MYSDCSHRYWKQRKRNFSLQSRVSLVLIIFTVMLLIGNAQRRKYLERHRLLLEKQRLVRPDPNEKQFEICELNMRGSIDLECQKLCNDELVSIPRPTMYKSCIHGCSRSIFSAAVIGCHMGSIEEAFQEENRVQGHNSCSRFQDVDPQPYVVSTCRKYYREGTKRGWNLGFDFINNLIDLEWEKIRNEV